MIRTGFALLLVTGLCAEQMAPWSPGTLDIHQIATGRGNAALFVLPDGTTLLVDAGAAGDGLPQSDPHPDGSRTPGAWIARYVKRHLPPGASGLDYALITHFHADHMGQLRPSSPFDPSGTFQLTGITEVAQEVGVRALIDRGWPDYSYPAALTDATMANYRRFVETRAKAGARVERFRPGATSQIHLVRDAAKYPMFQIRNIVGNGEVWTGTGESTRQLFPALATLSAADRPNENMCSLGIRVEYGRFRYFTGGDLPGTPDPGFPAWHSLEAGIAAAIGRVDVHVVNQHGSMGEESESFLEALRSTVLIVPAWAASHPAPDVLKRIINSRLAPSPRFVFSTEMRDAARIVIGPRAGQLAGPPGHIVVRVAPGGQSYQVFVLDYGDEKDTVLATKGPF